MKQQDFLSLQQQYWVVSRFWTRFSYSDCKKFRPSFDKKFPKSSFGNLELLGVTKVNFLNNHLTRTPINPKQQGLHEIGEEVLSSVGAQDMNTSGYELSDLDDIAFFWEKFQVELDAVFRPWIDTLFSPTNFNDFEMGERVSFENPIVLD